MHGLACSSVRRHPVSCLSMSVPPVSLRVSSVSVMRSDHSSICVSWRPVSAVSGYRIAIQSFKGNETFSSTSRSDTGSQGSWFWSYHPSLFLTRILCVAYVFLYVPTVFGSPDKQTKQEIVDASSSSYCFTELEPETVYRISVHSRLDTVEGAAVSILHPTGLYTISIGKGGYLVSCTTECLQLKCVFHI